MKRYFYLIVVMTGICSSLISQDIVLFNLQGSLPATYLNPGLKLDKNFNISLGNIDVLLGTYGPSVNQLTSKNALGERYFNIKDVANLDPYQNIFFKNDIHTLDISAKIAGIHFMAGHAFRSAGNVKYPKGLVKLLSEGNASSIGETIEVGPFIDVNAYNELYLGAQKSFGPLTVGVKGKILYGTANVTTERAKIDFTTDEEFYQLRFNTDYLVRSSALVRYNSLDSITTQYSGFSFDNLFYNNQGFALDLGASLQVGEKLVLSIGAVDLGKINWDFFPRKYVSKGNFVFEGVDIVDYVVDSTSLSIKDTLYNILKVSQGLENYSTTLNGTYSLGAKYAWNDKWTFSGLLIYQNNFSASRSALSLSAIRKISILDLGLHYTMAKNSFSSLGVFAKIKLGPVAAFASSDNVLGFFKPFDAKLVSARVGMTVQF